MLCQVISGHKGSADSLLDQTKELLDPVCASSRVGEYIMDTLIHGLSSYATWMSDMDQIPLFSPHTNCYGSVISEFVQISPELLVQAVPIFLSSKSDFQAPGLQRWLFKLHSDAWYFYLFVHFFVFSWDFIYAGRALYYRTTFPSDDFYMFDVWILFYLSLYPWILKRLWSCKDINTQFMIILVASHLYLAGDFYIYIYDL